jgi:transposase
MTEDRYDILEIDLMLKKGLSFRDIAKHYGVVSHASVTGWIRRNGYRVIEKRYIDPDTLKGRVMGK